MSITQSLLEMMESRLEVESVYGQGSTFSFDLEQKVVVWDQIGDYEQSYKDRQKTKERYKEKLHAPDVNVLVVDDNKVNLKVFRLLVKNTWIQTDTAESGDECLKKASEKAYDIIFLDHMMPGKDGTETLHELRQMQGPNRDTPVICLTADAV
ncbi:MAG: response regulator [Lachnospiraceae bacterium]|nr:response regulator [Lachnospiraceae bacterium]